MNLAVNLAPRPFLAGLLLAAAALAGPALPASDNDTQWISDKRGCKVANPFPQPDESITWSGACKDGFASGEGVLTFFLRGREHSRYQGTLERGWAEGRGVLKMPDGSTYNGQWANSQENGTGRREWADGSWYEGGWKNGRPHGQGQFRRPDGKIFIGEWVDGVYEGDIEPEDGKDDPNQT